MVRLSLVLGSVRYARRQKYIREKKGVYNINQYTRHARSILKAKGIPLIDPLTYINPPPPEWEPPKNLPDDFRLERFRKKEEEKPKGNPVWHISSRVTLTEGVDQACLLTNTQRFDGLPEQVKGLLGKYSINNQDGQVQDAIMLSQVWNNTKEKLPKHVDLENLRWRFPRQYGIPDSKSGHILMDSFLRLSQSMSGEFPDLTTERRVCCKPSLETTYDFRGETIKIECDNELMITGNRPLTQFGDDKMIRDSENHQLLDMFPVLPTVDFNKVYTMDLPNRGAFREALEIPYSHPQMMFRVNPGKKKAASHLGYNIMTTYGVAIAEASSRYGTYSGQLETPVTIISITNTFNSINYVVFQLNTMDVSKDQGVKNFVWCDTEYLFSKNFCKPWLEPDKLYKPPTYSDYNPVAFQKFLALYLYDYVK